MPQRHVLERGLRVRSQDPSETGDLLGFDRVALVWHRARTLLPARERLLDLGDLRAGEMANLGGEPLESRAGEGDRLQQLRVAIASHDLSRDGLGRQAEPAKHAALEAGRG